VTLNFASSQSTAVHAVALGLGCPDGPLPDIPETNQSKSGRERVVELARRDGLTVRQLAQRLGGYSGLTFAARRRPLPTPWRSGS
jgi:hypothetical protein